MNMLQRSHIAILQQQPKMATISMEKKREKNCLHKLFTLFIINIQLNELVEKLANT